jgi:transposase-like protein
MQQARQADTSTSPTGCPFCESKQISTVSKRPDKESYWRCAHCDEIWNALRLMQATQYGTPVSVWR